MRGKRYRVIPVQSHSGTESFLLVYIETLMFVPPLVDTVHLVYLSLRTDRGQSAIG
jgi:hypothetical protein